MSWFVFVRPHFDAGSYVTLCRRCSLDVECDKWRRRTGPQGVPPRLSSQWIQIVCCFPEQVWQMASGIPARSTAKFTRITATTDSSHRHDQLTSSQRFLSERIPSRASSFA